MNKKNLLFLLPALAMIMTGCNKDNGTDGDQTTGGGGSGETTLLRLDFTTAAKGSEIALDGAKAKMDTFKAEGDAEYSITAISKVYEGNGTGGALNGLGGVIKFGTGSAKGSVTFTFTSEVKKVILNCHSFYAVTDQYPTNTSNYVAVNSATPVALPYNATADGENVTFDVTGTSVTIETCNADATGSGRGVFYGMTFIA